MSDFIERPVYTKGLNCLHPVEVCPPGFSEPIKVPCGKCKACRLNKGYIHASNINNESKGDKLGICQFVTFTYDNTNLPLCYYVDDSSLDSDIIFRSFYDYDSHELLDTIIYDKEKIKKSKINQASTPINGTVPYLRKRDIQLFLKRARRNLSFRKIGTFRYFLVGEYGPTKGRPHYHALFWFETKEGYEFFTQNLLKNWTNGIVYQERVCNSASSYVSSYLNGFNNSDPFYNTSVFRQFNTHSVRLGQLYLDSVFFGSKGKKNIKGDSFKLEYKRFYGHVHVLNGRTKEIYPSHSYICTLFPRCYRFNSSYDEINLRRYTIASQTAYSPSIVVRSFEEYFSYGIIGNISTEYFYILAELFDIDISVYQYKVADDIRKTYHTRLYNGLSTSIRFLRQMSAYNFTARQYYDVITLYYTDCELSRICKALEQQQTISISNTPYSALDLLGIWYDEETIDAQAYSDYINYINHTAFAMTKKRKTNEVIQKQNYLS